jgi:AcrR family transcriptional regulator
MAACDHNHTMSVNRRTHRSPRSDTRAHDPTRVRRSQAERRSTTRRALLDAALEQLEAGVGFDSLSLRRVTRAAGIVPAAFYRHFASMDELGLALVEESVLTLRAMLRQAREDEAQRGDPRHVIARSVKILVTHVREHRRHFAFIAHARASGNAVLRHAIRAETKLFASELATDLARFPILREWTTADLQMLAGMFVDAMIAAIDSILEASSWGAGPPTLSPEREAEITTVTEKQLRLIALAIPHWRSRA